MPEDDEPRSKLHASSPGLEKLANSQADVRRRIAVAIAGGSLPTTLRDRLRLLGGESPRTSSGINISQAARKLGVSPDTVRRWVKAEREGTGQRPSATNMKKIARRTSPITKTGRRAIADQMRTRAAAAPRKTKLTIDGEQGPYFGDPEYLRDRLSGPRLSPDEVNDMLKAWEDGEEVGFMQWALGKYDRDYVSDWGITRLDSIEFE